MVIPEDLKLKLLQIEKNLKVYDFPPQIIIETTSRCNFSCHYCAHKKMKRAQADMEPRIFYKIIDEIAEKNPDAEIWPAFYGEPFLLGKALFKLLRYALGKNCSNIFLNTNGSMLISDQIRKELLDTGIKSLIISLDAYSADMFQKMRPGGNRDQIYQGIHLLLEEKQRSGLEHPAVICQFVCTQENRCEIDLFRRYWLERGADVKIRSLGSWAGAIRSGQPDYDDDFRIVCPIGNNTFAIHQNGNVAACCADFEGGFIAGNIQDKDIEEIWQTTLHEKIRKPFQERRFHDVPPICRQCRDWQICGAEYFSCREHNKKNYPFWLKEGR